MFLLFVIIRALLFGDPVAGWPSLMAAITLFGGVNLLGVGTVGLYISKIYSETKNRPLYIIEEEKQVIPGATSCRVSMLKTRTPGPLIPLYAKKRRRLGASS